MSFSAQIPFASDPHRARERALQVLMSQGFRVLDAAAPDVEAEGPSLNSSKENPLRGAGRLSLRFADGLAHLQADLAGIRGLTLLVFVLPITLGPVLSMTLGSGSSQALVMGVPWLVIGPLMAFWVRRRTERALETFLHNVARADG